jgi:IS5 family transposase
MLADALGRPLRFIVTAGQVGDITQAPALLEGQTGDAVLADKAYDSNACVKRSPTWELRW